MNGLEILIPLIAILVGGTAFIIPIAGLTARFAIKPLVESWSSLRETPASDARLTGMERRIELLEAQVQTLEKENARLLEDAEFRLRLGTSR